MYTTEPAPYGRRGTILVDEEGTIYMSFTDGNHAARAKDHADELNRADADYFREDVAGAGDA